MKSALRIWIPLGFLSVALIAGWLYGLYAITSSAKNNLSSLDISFEEMGTRIPCLGILDYGIRFTHYSADRKSEAEMRLCHEAFGDRWTLYKRNHDGVFEIQSMQSAAVHD